MALSMLSPLGRSQVTTEHAHPGADLLKMDGERGGDGAEEETDGPESGVLKCGRWALDIQ